MQNSKQIAEEKKGTRIDHPLPFKRLFSISQSATYLSKGVFTIREMVWNGTLPIVRDGRKILIDVRDLDTWIETNKTAYAMRVEDERKGNGKKKEQHAD
jgi:excisionase family DNA binding protein